MPDDCPPELSLIAITKPYHGLSLRETWFADEIKFVDALRPSQYIQCCSPQSPIGFRKTEFATKIIDLTQDKSALEAKLDKTAAYEIRRAQRDGILLAKCDDTDAFLAFQNHFYEEKNLPGITKRHISSLLPFMRIVQANHENAAIVMHAYLLDKGKKRCRLLYSASHFRKDTENLAWKAHVGRANRFLHWAAMLQFKDAGFEKYDLGGYALQTQDRQLQGINQFKDSFGGELCIEYNYTSWLTDLGQSILSSIKRRL